MVRWLKIHYDLIQALLPAFLVAAVLSVVGLAIRSAQESTNIRQAQTNRRLARVLAAQHVALVEGCERLNVLRAEDNISHYADYKVFGAVVRFPGLDGLTPIVRDAVSEKQWTPLTDCKRAVSQDGARYRAPAPIKFSVRVPPPGALIYQAP